MQQLIHTISLIGGLLRSQELRIWLGLLRRPALVVATLLLMVVAAAWLDVKIAAHVAQAQSTPDPVYACWSGTEQSGLRCYPPCQLGFIGLSSTCYKICPANYKNIDTTCRRDAHIFPKASEPRGAGRPLSCAFNQEMQAGLCYTRCPAGYYGVGLTCWQSCPAGYTDDGAFCRRPFPLHIFPKDRVGRAAGVIPNACPVGTERNGALCYPHCKAGFYGVGPVCFQRCPAGYTDDGATCRRDAHSFANEHYDRGNGEPLNAIPQAFDTSFATLVNQTTPYDFGFVDFDGEAGALYRVERIRLFRHGQSHSDGSGKVYYTPFTNFKGKDFLEWKTSDGKHASNVATVFITTGDLSDFIDIAPVALDRTVVVTEETPITIDVLCTDAENDELFYQLLDKPKHGEYEWLPPNTVIYTPTVDFVGTDSFTFRSHDARNFSNVSTITLTVNAVNDAPVVFTQPISTTRNNNAALVLAATDVESDTIRYSLVTSPTHGTLSGEIPNLIYTPDVDFVGEDSIQFQASDAHGATTAATIPISVLPINNAPLAESLVLTTGQESVVAVTLNASDADGDGLVYTLITSPTNGTVSGAGADLIYTPNAGFTGTDSFTYQANDGQADSPVTTVTIHVTAAPNQANVSGIVYEDRNGNGQVDGADVGVPGLLVTLTPASGRVGESYSTLSEAGGGWYIDGVPFGQYTVQVTGGNGVQIEQPDATNLTIGQRGLQQLSPTSVKVTGRALFLPLIQR